MLTLVECKDDADVVQWWSEMETLSDEEIVS